MCRHVALSCVFLGLLGAASQSEGDGPVFASQKLGPSPAVAVWAASDLEAVFPDSKAQQSNGIWNAGADGGTITLKAAKNEYVAAQIVIRAEGKAVADVDVAVGPWQGLGKLPAQSVSLYRVWYVTVGGKEYPNQTIPFAAKYPFGAPFDIGSVKPGSAQETALYERSRNQPVFVEILVPDQIAAGLYETKIDVTVAGKTARRITLKLTVWDFRLPGERHVRAYAPFYPGYIVQGEGVGYESVGRAKHITDPLWNMMRLYYCLAHEHRLDTCESEMSHQTARAEWDRKTGRLQSLDWQNYDKYYRQVFATGEIFRDGVPSRCFELPHPFRGSTINHTTDEKAAPVAEGWSGEPFRRLGSDLAAEIVRHFDQRKWPLQNTFLYFVDEPVGKLAYEIQRRFFRAVEEGGGGRARIMLTAQPDPLVSAGQISWDFAAGWLSPAANPALVEDCAHIWAPAAAFYDPGDMAWEQAHGRECWFYGSPCRLSDPLVAVNAAGLAAWKYRVDGMFQWVINFASGYQGHGFLDAYYTDARDGDGLILYMGKPVGVEGPVATLRMKALRRGLQDYEYCWLLKQAGRLDAADQIVASLVKRALHDDLKYDQRWVLENDPNQWLAARERLAEALLRKGPQSGPAGWLPHVAGLAAENVGFGGKVRLSWKPVDGSTPSGYVVYRGAAGAGRTTGGVPAMSRLPMYGSGALGPAVYDDYGLKSGKYFYQVAAVDKTGREGPPCEPAAVQVQSQYGKAEAKWYVNGLLPERAYNGIKSFPAEQIVSLGNANRNQQRYWLQFTGLGLPKQAKVLKAVLRIPLYDKGAGPLGISLFRPESIGPQGLPSADYLDADGKRNGGVPLAEAKAVVDFPSFDVTGIIQQYVSGNWADTGLLLVAGDPPQKTTKRGYGAAYPAAGPRLEIYYLAK